MLRSKSNQNTGSYLQAHYSSLGLHAGYAYFESESACQPHFFYLCAKI
jgi:hypothetical protein